MQDTPKAVWTIPYISVAFFPNLKHNFIAYHSSKVSSHPDYIFEIHQLWQSGFSWVYSNSCCSCSFESEIIKIGQSSHKIYSNKILNFQESTTILNACTKKSGNLLNAPRIYIYIYIYIYTHSHISSSSSCCAASTDLPDPLSPPISIIHGSQEVFKTISCIGTELFDIDSSWSSCVCSSM